MSPMDDIPTTGGMNTSSSNTGSTSKKRESTTLGYVNISIGGMRIGSVQIETNPYGFSSNPVHKSLVELFSYDLTPDELKSEVSELIETLGIEFNCQLAGSEKNIQPTVDYASKFSGRSKRTIKS